MTDEKLFSAEKYLEETSQFTDAQVLEEKQGDNNRNFVFRSDGEKYVLRKSKAISEQKNTLENERKILTFLENSGIDFVPRSIHFDSKEEIHVISFVGERSVEIEDLGTKKLRIWARKLTRIHEPDFQSYQEFCKQNNYSYTEPEKPIEKLKRFRKDFRQLDNRLQHEELGAFVEEKLNYLIETKKSENLNETFLTHSDLAGSTRIEGNKFKFIDWEFAGFNYNPITDLAIILAHRDLNQKQVSALKSTYKDCLEIQGSFEKELHRAKNIRYIFNIIWCLERLPESTGSERERYLDFAQKQKKEFSQNL